MELRALVGTQRLPSQPRKCPTFVNAALQSSISLINKEQLNETYYQSLTESTAEQNQYTNHQSNYGYVLPKPLYTASQSIIKRPKKRSIGSLYNVQQRNTRNILNKSDQFNSSKDSTTCKQDTVQLHGTIRIAKMKPEQQQQQMHPEIQIDVSSREASKRNIQKFNINMEEYTGIGAQPETVNDKKIELDLTDVVKRQSIDIVESRQSHNSVTNIQPSECHSAHSVEDKHNYLLKPKGLLLLQDNNNNNNQSIDNDDELLVQVPSERPISQAARLLHPLTAFQRSQTEFNKGTGAGNLAAQRSQPIIQQNKSARSPAHNTKGGKKVQQETVVQKANTCVNQASPQPNTERMNVIEVTKSSRISVIKNTSTTKLSILPQELAQKLEQQQQNAQLQQHQQLQQKESQQHSQYLRVPADSNMGQQYNSRTRSNISKDRLGNSIAHTPPDWSAVYLDLDQIPQQQQQSHQRTQSLTNPLRVTRKRRQQSQVQASANFARLIQNNITEEKQQQLIVTQGREMIFSQSTVPQPQQLTDKGMPTPQESNPTSHSIQVVVKNTCCGTDEFEGLMFEDKLDDQISSQDSSDILTSSMSNTEGKSHVIGSDGITAHEEGVYYNLTNTGDQTTKSNQAFSRNGIGSRQQGLLSNTRVIFKTLNGQNKIVYFDQTGRPIDLGAEKAQKTERLQVFGDHIRPLKDQNVFMYSFYNQQQQQQQFSKSLCRDASVKMSQSFYNEQTARMLKREVTKDVISQYLDNPQTIRDSIQYQENMVIQDEHGVQDKSKELLSKLITATNKDTINSTTTANNAYIDQQENTGVLTSKKQSVDQLSSAATNTGNLRSLNLSIAQRTLIPTVLITSSQSPPKRDQLNQQRQFSQEKAGVYQARIQQQRNVVQSRDIYSNMQGRQLFTNSQISRVPLAGKQRGSTAAPVSYQRMKDDKSDSIDTLRAFTNEADQDSVKSILEERSRLLTMHSLNRSLDRSQQERSQVLSKPSNGTLFSQISNQFRETQNKWTMKIDRDTSQILEMKERPSQISLDRITTKRQSMQVVSNSPAKQIKLLNTTMPLSSKYHNTNSDHTHYTQQQFHKTLSNYPSDVTSTYQKYLQAERNVSKKDRILYNLDKTQLQTRAYPFIIPTTKAAIFNERSESMDLNGFSGKSGGSRQMNSRNGLGYQKYVGYGNKNTT